MRLGRLPSRAALTQRWWFLSALSVRQQPLLASVRLLTPPAAPSAACPSVSEAGLFQKRILPWSATINWLSATATPPPEAIPAPVRSLPTPPPNNRLVGTVGEAPGANMITSF